MDVNTIYEIVGIVGSFLVLVSFLFKSPIWIRPINIVGCIILVVYAFMIDAVATWVLNIGLVVVHIVYLSIYLYQALKARAINLKKPVHYEIVEGKGIAKIKSGKLVGLKAGDVTVVAHYGDTISAPLTFHVEAPLKKLSLSADVSQVLVGTPVVLKCKGAPRGSSVSYEILSGEATVEGNVLVASKAGPVSVVASASDLRSEPLIVDVLDPTAKISVTSQEKSLLVGASIPLSYELSK